MGFDIDIFQGEEHVDSSYLSYNWSVFKDIFYIRDVDDKDSEHVENLLQRGLDKLKEMGYTANDNMRVDGWGKVHRKPEIKTFDTDEYTDDLHCMFAWHLNRLLLLAHTHPGATWQLC